MLLESAYPHPPSPRFRSVSPRKLVQIRPSPRHERLPTLPSPLRQPSFSAYQEWTLSTHIIPGAYPRTLPHVPPPSLLPYTQDRQARSKWVEDTVEKLAKMHNNAQEAHARGSVSEGSTEPLWCVVNRYARRDATGEGVTLFLAHANGFPKEIWEPTLSCLLSPAGEFGAHNLIDEVWAWEAIQHGDAALLNGDRAGGVFDWSDNARDIIQFLVHYRPFPKVPEQYYKTTLPVHLPRVPEAVASQRLSKDSQGAGEASRLVAIGHSFGGCSLALAIATYPTLFQTLILIDPIITTPDSYNPIHKVREGLKRRSQWAGRQEAHELLANHPYFSRWHPRVLDIYIECALTEDEDATPALPAQPVKLKMSPVQEGVVFAEKLTAYETWERLADISLDAELRWIMPGAFFLVNKQTTLEAVWRRPENSSHVVVEGAGHLIPQEKPNVLAYELGRFLTKKFGVNGNGRNVKANL